MSKFFVLMTVMYGLLLMLSIAGIDTGGQDVIDSLTPKDPGNITMSNVTSFNPVTVGFGWFLMALAAACITGLAYQYITKSSPDLYVAGLFIGLTCIPLLYGYYNLITYVGGAYPGTWIYYVTMVIVSFLGLAYLVSAADWIMNRGGN